MCEIITAYVTNIFSKNIMLDCCTFILSEEHVRQKVKASYLKCTFEEENITVVSQINHILLAS